MKNEAQLRSKIRGGAADYRLIVSFVLSNGAVIQLPRMPLRI